MFVHNTVLVFLKVFLGILTPNRGKNHRHIFQPHDFMPKGQFILCAVRNLCRGNFRHRQAFTPLGVVWKLKPAYDYFLEQ